MSQKMTEKVNSEFLYLCKMDSLKEETNFVVELFSPSVQQVAKR